MTQAAVNEAAANLEAQSIFRAADLIAAERVRQINDALTRYNVDYRVCLGEATLTDAAVALAEAQSDAQHHENTMQAANVQLAQLEQTIGDYLEGQETIRAGTASLDAARTLGEIRADICALRAVAAVARTMLGIADGGSQAAEVSRCVRDLDVAHYNLLSSVLDAHAKRMERGLVDAVSAIRAVNEIVVRHAGDAVFSEWIPSPETAVLFCLGVTQ